MSTRTQETRGRKRLNELKRLELKRDVFNHFKDDRNLDLSKLTFEEFPKSLLPELASYARINHFNGSGCSRRFFNHLKELAIQNDWSPNATVYKTVFDFSEYHGTPLHVERTINVYLGLTRDFKIGTASARFVEHELRVRAVVDTDIHEDLKEQLDRRVLGVGYFNTSELVSVYDLYFN